MAFRVQLRNSLTHSMLCQWWFGDKGIAAVKKLLIAITRGFN